MFAEFNVDDDMYLWQSGNISSGISYELIDGYLYLISEQGLTKDEYFTKDNPIKWSQIANRVELETQPTMPEDSTSVYQSNEAESIGVDETKKVTIFYNTLPCIEASATLTGTGAITEAIYYAWGAELTIYSATAGTYNIGVMARPLVVANKQRIVKQDDKSIIDNGIITYNYPENPLVQTRTQAELIASTLLEYYKNPRKDASISWRGNPSWELADNVTVLDSSSVDLYTIVRQELEYNGGLKTNMSGRKT